MLVPRAERQSFWTDAIVGLANCVGALMVVQSCLAFTFSG